MGQCPTLPKINGRQASSIATTMALPMEMQMQPLPMPLATSARGSIWLCSKNCGPNPPVYQVGYPCCGHYILFAFTTVFESHFGHPK
jgi:hypothetical protein